MRYDLYAWHAPRDLTAEQAAALVERWEAEGGDPAASPFEPSTDVAWFFRELVRDEPDVEIASDGVPLANNRPIFLQVDDPAPARIAAIRLGSSATREAASTIFSLAMKYDLALFEPNGPSLRFPLQAMSSHASATFWPRGAIRSVVAGVIGGALTVGAYALGIPIVSGVVMVVGVFLVVLTTVTLVAEARKRWGDHSAAGTAGDVGTAAGPPEDGDSAT